MATAKIDRTGAHTEVTTAEAHQGHHVGLIWVLSISLALSPGSPESRLDSGGSRSPSAPDPLDVGVLKTNLYG